MTKEDNNLSGANTEKTAADSGVDTAKQDQTPDDAGDVIRTPEKLNQIPLHKLDMKRLIELDACTRCGECLTWCPVYDQDSKEDLIPRAKLWIF